MNTRIEMKRQGDIASLDNLRGVYYGNSYYLAYYSHHIDRRDNTMMKRNVADLKQYMYTHISYYLQCIYTIHIKYCRKITNELTCLISFRNLCKSHEKRVRRHFNPYFQYRWNPVTDIGLVDFDFGDESDRVDRR